MKKLLPLVFLSLSLSAEPTLQKAFTDGDINAEIQLFYYNIDKKNGSNAYATSTGGYLKYSTDTKNPFFASIRFHTSNPTFDSTNREKTALFKKDGTALTAISESFLAYRTKSRILKVGNFMLNTPMMNDDTTRIVPWSYRGFAYTGESIKNLKVQLYYIDAIRSNTTDEYKKQSASGEFDSITMFSLHYNGISGLKTGFYYYYSPKLYSTFVAQGDYDIALNANTLLCFGVQYFKSGDGGKYAKTDDKNGGDNINLVALRSSIDAKNYSLSLNYSQNFGLSGVVGGYGGAAKVYTTSMIANGRGNYKPETWMLKGNYDLDLGKYHSEVALTLTNTQTKDQRGDDFNAYYLHFKHFFTKEASIYLRYESLKFTSSKKDANYFRAIATYKF
ncbi:hypothetical protein M947_10790 [Sulfurimonas hongkongensis]|uniref:Porin n=1 Tax=Sulfurimonas hongkongensis TaxID=1172190 RepID=T0J0A1_9BACT|nr:OprD family outer membrane porin [Sulfurimonas hongkongensis]EQB34485.1 hypothetical protein M947_10790 [Sulfurimonas hongkongensis]